MWCGDACANFVYDTFGALLVAHPWFITYDKLGVLLRVPIFVNNSDKSWRCASCAHFCFMKDDALRVMSFLFEIC